MTHLKLISLPTSKLRTFVYHNDPIFFLAELIVQRIKGTLGITG